MWTVYNVGGEAYFCLMDLLHVLDINYRYDTAWDSFKVATGTYHNSKVDPGIDEKGYQAVPSQTGIYVDGTKINFDAYTINGKDFVKIRDLAQSLKGTPRSFGLEWDDSIKMIMMDQEFDGLFVMHYRQPYESVGGELTPGDGQSKTATRLHADHSGKELPKVDGAWYMPYYTYCLEQGILEEGELSADDLSRSATRFEMVDLLDRAAQSEKTAGTVNRVADGFIPDLSEGDHLGEVVYRWYRAGILTGDTQHNFNGPKNITRAEVSVILCQLLGFVDRAKL